MSIFSTTQSIFTYIKNEFLAGLHFIKQNDVSKLIVAFIFITSFAPKDGMPPDFSLHWVIRMVMGVISLVAIFYFLSFMYYSTFSIKKTVYKFSKNIYFFMLIILMLYTFLKFNNEKNNSFIIIYEMLYICVLLIMVIHVRKIFIQQYLNVQTSIFKVITQKTGLIVVASTPYGIFGKKKIPMNNYMIGFNPVISTWILLGIFFKMDRNTVCLNKVWISYDTIMTFNNHFNKKLTQYNKDEIKTVIMYSF